MEAPQNQTEILDSFRNRSNLLVIELMEAVQKYNCYDVLTDLREAKIHLTTFELYNAPQMIGEIISAINVPITKFRRAVVAKKDSANLRFLENVNFNKGHVMELFEDIDAAKQWLKNNI